MGIKRQELRLYYQPIVSLETPTLAGFEALVRWEHP
ncbi:MAG: EAL domain-containing protein, partial [Moorea sp. SIO2I5]|nr:EAL domain-containing protein [Moorena sp. SIO2I5]